MDRPPGPHLGQQRSSQTIHTRTCIEIISVKIRNGNVILCACAWDGLIPSLSYVGVEVDTLSARQHSFMAPYPRKHCISPVPFPGAPISKVPNICDGWKAKVADLENKHNCFNKCPKQDVFS